MSNDSYYLGVDGGGSKTLAVIVDAQGRERGRGHAGSANHTGVGLEQALQPLLFNKLLAEFPALYRSQVHG